mmetsp:Transcript_15783/g.61663  ORF Transcript_15783/g.61663 Transcript_15783/m.61663 type:complete len:239 (-) Transcript_15783:2451-3167(-)
MSRNACALHTQYLPPVLEEPHEKLSEGLLLLLEGGNELALQPVGRTLGDGQSRAKGSEERVGEGAQQYLSDAGHADEGDEAVGVVCLVGGAEGELEEDLPHVLEDELLEALHLADPLRAEQLHDGEAGLHVLDVAGSAGAAREHRLHHLREEGLVLSREEDALGDAVVGDRVEEEEVLPLQIALVALFLEDVVVEVEEPLDDAREAAIDENLDVAFEARHQLVEQPQERLHVLAGDAL